MPDLDSLVTEEGLDVRESPLSLMDWGQKEMKSWMALQVQGVGADHFCGDRISYSWLTDPT